MFYENGTGFSLRFKIPDRGYVDDVVVTEDKITCTIPPVAPSHDTVLTCHFPEDLSVTKKDFTIYRYVEHSNPGDKSCGASVVLMLFTFCF